MTRRKSLGGHKIFVASRRGAGLTERLGVQYCLSMRLGVDRVLEEKALQLELKGKKLAVVAHPASVTSSLKHTLDALMERKEFSVVSAFGPQHGMKGEKQENMIESEDYRDPHWNIPVHSLYGEHRKPTRQMLDGVDLVLFDLQDIGCRIYTYLTTLLYIMEACAETGKTLWVLDRPNPAGRPIEGNILQKEWMSFVGACAIPMRHGMTLGELALWLQKHHSLNLDLRVIEMTGYFPDEGPGWGWPLGELSWVNPSPNIPTLSSTRAFCGTVLLEGTSLSEGRGTTRPLEVVGAPGLDVEAIEHFLEKNIPEAWRTGFALRPCYFEPMFHKHAGKLCRGFQLHVDDRNYDHHRFKAFRWTLGFFKAVRTLQPELLVWRQPPYEYENVKLPVDILNGSAYPREWVDDAQALCGDLDSWLRADEKAFAEMRRPYLLYPDLS